VDDPKTPAADGPKHPAAGNPKAPLALNLAYPRRALVISISKYMYLNPLTATRNGIDNIRVSALRLAYDWRIPSDKDNNQVFVMADTVMAGTEDRLPMKNVVMGSYQEFFKTSRAQDRIVVYFGGHAVFKDGKAFIAPMEADVEGEDWEKSLIPLGHFYDELKKCKSTQKVVIWDVCRFNPEKGRVRPGSEPMSEELFKALSSPPQGVQAVVTCKAGENAMEYTYILPEVGSGARDAFSGSAFLDALRFVAEPRNSRLPKSTATAADALPIAEWTPAIAKRAVEMSEVAERNGSPGKQTVALFGAATAPLAVPDPSEPTAARFDFPRPPPGASAAEIGAITRDIALPPLKADLDIGLVDFPFPAEIIKEYAEDVSVEEVRKNRAKFKLRNVVLDAMNVVRIKWTGGVGAARLRENVPSPLDEKRKKEVKKEMEFWAEGIRDLELQLVILEDAGDRKAAETKRWQANYDYALATVKMRLVYMQEYHKILGNIVTETVPQLDAKLSQDGWALVSSNELKGGKEAKKLWTEAQTLFQDISVKYKGTPWAVQAKREKSVVIGLTWKAAVLNR
jgi:hypothetical protein